MKELEIPKRTLGKSGIEVTEIGLGLWAAGGGMWGPADDKESLDMIDLALDKGITFYDTADVYGSGHSEKILGRAMKGRRDRFTVATKIGWQNFNSDDNSSGYTTVEKVVSGVETNLKRLGTDHVDLIQFHIGFRESTMEIFLEGFTRLQKEGKVRAYGLSTSDLAYLKEFNADGNCASLQIDYSLLNRTPEADVLPYCRANNIGVIIRGALAMGILTGKLKADSSFEEKDFRTNWINDPDRNKIYLEDLEKTEKLKPLAKNKTMAQLALRFILDNSDITTVIPGARRPSQLEDNIQATALEPLTDEEYEVINSITPIGGGRKIWPA